jgi:hypothetical protein
VDDQNKAELVKTLLRFIEVEQRVEILPQDIELWGHILMEAPESILLASKGYGTPDTINILSYIKKKLNDKKYIAKLNHLSLERKIAHRECAIEQNLKNRKANTNYGLATSDLNAFLLLKITG